MMERYRLALTREAAAPPFGGQLLCPDDAVGAARALIGDEPVEVIIAMHLDQRHRLRGYHEVGRGGITTAPCEMPSLFTTLLLSGMPAFMVAHNHPSGDPEPSVQDRTLTARIRRGADLLGLEFVDHVVLGAAGHVSIRAASSWGD